jgi:hypothetical protein
MPTPSRFRATLDIIGINPFVSVPDRILRSLFKAAGKEKGVIPVKGTVNDGPYTQSLVRYKGAWRLYINTIMLDRSPKRIGETLSITIAFDPADRTVPMHPGLKKALAKNLKAKKVFDSQSPSRQKEINRYLHALKSNESVTKNVDRAIRFLAGKDDFVGRDRL